MISMVLTGLALLYYVLWVGQGLLKPSKDLALRNIQYQIDNTTDEQWVQKLKDVIKFKLAQFDRELANGDITQKEYHEKADSYKKDYVDITEDPEGAEPDIDYIKNTLKKGLLKSKLSIIAVQLAYRLLAGVPLVIFLLTGAVQISLLACFIFLLTYSIISDIVITRDEERIAQYAEEDGEDYFMDEQYNFSKVTLIAYTAVKSQLPFLIILLLA